MKTIEYPIKELVSLKMDERKLWYLDYNKEHECFPPMEKKWGKGNEYFSEGMIPNKKGYKDFLEQLVQYLLELNLRLEGSTFFNKGRLINRRRRTVGWKDPYVLLNNDLPKYLIPYHSTNEGYGFPNMVFNGREGFHDNAKPYYGNKKYEKYVENNNGECPLPLPKSVFSRGEEQEEQFEQMKKELVDEQ